MDRAICTSALLALVAFGGPRSIDTPELQLQEERVTIEYRPATGEAVLDFEAEAEVGLESIEVCAPDGERVLELSARAGRGVALQGMVLETAEVGVEALAKTFAPGVYRWRARAEDGRSASGAAELSHRMPEAPTVLQPADGAQDVPLDLVLSWVPRPGVARYRIVVEQGENDGLTLELPGRCSALEVPPGVLVPHAAGHVEVGAIAANGNVTLTQVDFTTR